MVTETLRPDNPGDECNITDQIGVGCPNHYQNVDEVVSDETTTMVREAASPYTTYRRDLYSTEDSAVGAGTINFIKVYTRSYRAGLTNQVHQKICMKTGGTAYEGAAFSVTTVFVNYSNQWNTNPQAVRDWNWADIDALQIGVSLRCPHNGGSGVTASTQVWLEVDYTVAAAAEGDGAGAVVMGTKSLILDLVLEGVI